MKRTLRKNHPHRNTLSSYKQQKSECTAQIKQIESEMKRLQGRIIAEMGKGCTATCQRGGNS